MEPLPIDDGLLVGHVARAHGLAGQVIVSPETDFLDRRFRVDEVLLVGTAPRVARRILAARFHQGRPILSLEGIETVEQAEALAGAELRVPTAALGALPEGTFYHHDLIGCELRDRSDAVLGRVVSVEGTIDRSRLVVACDRGEFEVPLTAPICVSVDVASRRILTDPPEGLLDLVAPAPPRRRAAN